VVKAGRCSARSLAVRSGKKIHMRDPRVCKPCWRQASVAASALQVCVTARYGREVGAVLRVQWCAQAAGSYAVFAAACRAHNAFVRRRQGGSPSSRCRVVRTNIVHSAALAMKSGAARVTTKAPPRVLWPT